MDGHWGNTRAAGDVLAILQVPPFAWITPFGRHIACFGSVPVKNSEITWPG